MNAGVGAGVANPFKRPASPTIQIVPNAGFVNLGSSLLLTTLISNATTTSPVNWAITSGGGTLSAATGSSVTFNAPATATIATITATLTTDGQTIVATATVTVSSADAPVTWGLLPGAYTVPATGVDANGLINGQTVFVGLGNRAIIKANSATTGTQWSLIITDRPLTVGATSTPSYLRGLRFTTVLDRADYASDWDAGLGVPLNQGTSTMQFGTTYKKFTDSGTITSGDSVTLTLSQTDLSRTASTPGKKYMSLVTSNDGGTTWTTAFTFPLQIVLTAPDLAIRTTRLPDNTVGVYVRVFDENTIGIETKEPGSNIVYSADWTYLNLRDTDKTRAFAFIYNDTKPDTILQITVIDNAGNRNTRAVTAPAKLTVETTVPFGTWDLPFWLPEQNANADFLSTMLDTFQNSGLTLDVARQLSPRTANGDYLRNNHAPLYGVTPFPGELDESLRYRIFAIPEGRTNDRLGLEQHLEFVAGADINVIDKTYALSATTIRLDGSHRLDGTYQLGGLGAALNAGEYLVQITQPPVAPVENIIAELNRLRPLGVFPTIEHAMGQTVRLYSRLVHGSVLTGAIPSQTVYSIGITPNSAQTLNVGGASVNLTALIGATGGSVPTGATVTWTTSTPNVTLTPSGNSCTVSGANAGSAIVTASYGGATANVSFTVNAAIATKPAWNTLNTKTGMEMTTFDPSVYASTDAFVNAVIASPHALVSLSPRAYGLPGNPLWTSAQISAMKNAGKWVLCAIDIAQIDPLETRFSAATLNGTAAYIAGIAQYSGYWIADTRNTTWRTELYGVMDAILATGYDGFDLKHVDWYWEPVTWNTSFTNRWSLGGGVTSNLTDTIAFVAAIRARYSSARLVATGDANTIEYDRANAAGYINSINGVMYPNRYTGSAGRKTYSDPHYQYVAALGNDHTVVMDWDINVSIAQATIDARSAGFMPCPSAGNVIPPIYLPPPAVGGTVYPIVQPAPVNALQVLEVTTVTSWTNSANQQLGINFQLTGAAPTGKTLSLLLLDGTNTIVATINSGVTVSAIPAGQSAQIINYTVPSGLTNGATYKLAIRISDSGGTIYPIGTFLNGLALVTDVTYGGTAPDFTLSLSGSVTFNAGNTGNIIPTITRLGAFNSSVQITVTGMPSGVTATPSTVTLPNGTTSTTIAFSSTSATTPGTYPITFTAVGGGVTKTSSANLIINASSGFTARPGLAPILAEPLWMRWDSSSSASEAQVIAYPGGITLQWFFAGSISNVVTQRANAGKWTGGYRDAFRVNPTDSSLWNQTFTAADGTTWTVNASSPFLGGYDSVYGAYKVTDPEHKGWKAVMKFMIQQGLAKGIKIWYVDDISSYGFTLSVAVIESHMRAMEYWRATLDSLTTNGIMCGNFDGGTMAYCWHTSDLTDAQLQSGSWAFEYTTTRATPRGTWMSSFDWLCTEKPFTDDGGNPTDTTRRQLETGWLVASKKRLGSSHRCDRLDYPRGTTAAVATWNDSKSFKPYLDGAGMNGAGASGPNSGFTYPGILPSWYT